MCATTFVAVKDMAGELGCVTHEGAQLHKMGLPSWLSWWG